MTNISGYIGLIILTVSCAGKGEKEFEIISGNSTAVIYLDNTAGELIAWAANELAGDMEAITGTRPAVKSTDHYELVGPGKGIYIGKFDDDLINTIPGFDPAGLPGKWEAFSMEILAGDLVLAGSDTRGTVYAVFDLAERLGISPWKWWADVRPEKRDELILRLPEGKILSSPSVQYRGIFLNDEDWGLQPWAAKLFEPETGDIGPKTYEKVFQLLLRLKANTIWPAMHPCTQAFFTVPGNREMAEKYHIVIGTSHAEPMLRNNVSEWNEKERGEFNYFTNEKEVDRYWQERIDELDPGKDHFIVTLGMRGIHDSGMEGDATLDERADMLERIIGNQRRMLENSLDRPAETIPQVFVPYKEVLGLYNAGLELPGDITLMWTDDNYGYIRRLSNEAEQKREGGSGIYYHLSYWGRPHDYLWLSTTQPGLIWFEMTRAYRNGAGKIWIANVGDLKPAEYNTEFFLDLAWDIDMVNEDNLYTHLEAWAGREFGAINAGDIANLMQEYYRLAFLRKPEFMGWSRTEPSTDTKMTEFNPAANGNELQRRLDAYKALYEQSDRTRQRIPPENQDAYFQLVGYPVKCAALMNYKFLYAQLAGGSENGDEKEAFSAESRKAYREITELTAYYNDRMRNGKWKHMMDMHPRDLAVFRMPEYNPLQGGTPEIPDSSTGFPSPVFIQAADYSYATGAGEYRWKPVRGLGYSNRAITLMPLRTEHFDQAKPSVTYRFWIGRPGTYEIEIRCLPTHSNNFDQELGVRVDDQFRKIFALNTRGRSEAWKRNVLRNYQSLKYVFEAGAGKHELSLEVNQTGIVIDQIAVNPAGGKPYYEIPPGGD